MADFMEKIEGRYAEIVLPLPIPGPLTYRIPLGLQDQAQVGKRALVPLGGRLLTGYIVGFAEKTDLAQTKEVQEILDREPLLDEPLLALCRFVAERYLCPLGLAIRAALPPGIDASTKQILVLKVPPETLSPERLKLPSPFALGVVTSLREKGQLSVKGLKRRYGFKEAWLLIRYLEQEGIAEVESKLILPKVRPKRERFIELSRGGPELGEIIEFLKVKAPKQAALLEALRERGPMRVAEAKAMVGPSALKGLLEKGLIFTSQQEVVRDPFKGPFLSSQEPGALTPHQQAAVKAIHEGLRRRGFAPFLLFGITGSGKTEVYLQVIQKVLEEKRQALVLVPEIALTPLVVSRFRARFGERVAVLHSGLSPGERFDQWMRVKRGEADIVVGARSAVFAPLPRLGIIVVDEEHDPSYKQEEDPRYHARDVALKKAEQLKIPIILGSATPSFESFHKAESGCYRLLVLPERVERRSLPTVRLVDLKKEPGRLPTQARMPIFSQELLVRIEERLKKKEQILLFLNRRGYATFVLCRECGFALGCPRCSTSLTYHAKERRLRCHSCDFTRRPPSLCPRCGGFRLGYLGFGTQQVEEAVKGRFPQAKVARMDRDTTKGREAHQRLLKALEEGRIDILVGTQMIGKGHDFPRITLVGVISADLSLHLPDFRAAERTFALLTQVVGRAGRGAVLGEALIQTYNPDHYCLQAVLSQDYETLYRAELLSRAERALPPFASLIRLLVSSPKEDEAKEAAKQLADLLPVCAASVAAGRQGPFHLDGPAPCFLYKVKRRFRWQLLVKGEEGTIRGAVLMALKQFTTSGRVKVEVDVDPVELL